MNIYDKKYQIFISSTYTDLVEARNEVIKTLLNLHQLPIGMEMFSADNDEQWSVIQETIDSSDYYILIVGQRYGSMTKEGISYTEKEFDYAVSTNVPVLIFVQDEQVATTPEKRDSEPEKIAKLQEFRRKVISGKMANFWRTEIELAGQVQTALIKSFTRHPRTGWVRGNQAASPQVASEMAALSQENRELKKQLEQILAGQNNRKPAFQLFANGQSHLELTYLDDPKQPYQLLEPIHSSYDFPHHLNEYYNSQTAEVYNQQLATNAAAVNEYNQSMIELNRKINGSTETRFTIKNLGNAKANELYVELTFPPELLLMTERPSNYTKHSLPEGVTINPIKEAEEAFLRRNGRFPPLEIGYSGLKMPTILNFAIADNKLTIKAQNLLHTREVSIDNNVYICPLTRGHFEISVSYVCEEFDEVQHENFSVDVA